MSILLVVKACAIWTVILVLAVLNGALREGFLIPALGAAPALVASGVLLSVLIVVVAYLSLPWLDTRGTSALAGIGLGWLALTLIFEFSFGYWQGKSWQVMLDAYTFDGANTWPAVLVVVAFAPCFAARLRGWR